MDIHSVLGINIRKLRDSKKLSQEEPAFSAGIDRAYLSSIENGHRKLSVAVLDQIAMGLKVKITDLFAGYKSN